VNKDRDFDNLSYKEQDILECEWMEKYYEEKYRRSSE
jgi:hypothetical protein